MSFDQIRVELKDLYGSTRLGASAASLDDFEARYAVRLPEDLRAAYLLMDGADESTNPHASWMRFWPIQEVVPAEGSLPPGNAAHSEGCLFVIADYAIECVYYVIELRPGSATFGHVYGIGATRLAEVARSFSEFVQLVLADSDQLHSYS